MRPGGGDSGGGDDHASFRHRLAPSWRSLTLPPVLPAGLRRRAPGPDGYVYSPVQRTEAVAAGALQRMIDTFFAGSAASAATALLGLGQKLTPQEAAALERIIDESVERGS